MNAVEFANAWEAGWNSHDLDLIMSHYREDVVFRSCKAIQLVGQGEIRGKTKLRAYWAAALGRQPDLRFEVQEVFEGYQMMALRYRNHRQVLAVETLYFDEHDFVYQAAASHAVAPR